VNGIESTRLAPLPGYSRVFVRSWPEAHVVYVIFDKHFTCTGTQLHRHPHTGPKTAFESTMCVCVCVWAGSVEKECYRERKSILLGYIKYFYFLNEKHINIFKGLKISLKIFRKK